MASVKCIARHAVSLPSGRLLPPGETATDVDLKDAAAQALVSAGQLVVVDTFDPVDHTVAEVLTWVGNDPDRAAAALATESARPEGDQRSTLTDKLAELVDHTDDSSEED